MLLLSCCTKIQKHNTRDRRALPNRKDKEISLNIDNNGRAYEKMSNIYFLHIALDYKGGRWECLWALGHSLGKGKKVPEMLGELET